MWPVMVWYFPSLSSLGRLCKICCVFLPHHLIILNIFHLWPKF
jgi:hypothetical protein